MNDKVIGFPGLTRIDTPPDRVLEKAIGELEGVVICGKTKDGSFYVASFYADGGDALWYLMRAQHRLLTIADELES